MSGQLCNILLLFSKEMPDEGVSIYVPQDFSDTGTVFFIFTNNNQLTKLYDLKLVPEDAKRVFLMVARAVNNMKFRKNDTTTLNIDV